MNWFKRIITHRHMYDDLAEEMRLHLEEKIEQLVESGVSRSKAEFQAKCEFGNATLIAERSFEIWRWPTIEGLWRDIRHATRRLRKSAGFTVVCVFTIAIGIGANTAIFTVDYATLLAPLPYPQPDRLVAISSRVKGNGGLASEKDFADWKRESHAFQALTAFKGASFNIAGGDQLETIFGTQVTSNYYGTLGSSFFMGRDFLPEEGQEGKNHVVILTHQLWQHLGSDPNLVGHTIPVDGALHSSWLTCSRD
jgi:MacB-like periplasmic core domain